jgi:RND family efflux transporter MFP subunit
VRFEAAHNAAEHERGKDMKPRELVRKNRAGRFASFFRISLFMVLILLTPAFSWGQSPKGPPPAPVVAQPVIETEIRESITLVGTAEAQKRALVATQVEGWVEEVSFQEGDLREQNVPLVRLEANALKLELQGARAALKETEERLNQALADFRRLEALYSSESISQKRFQDAQFEVNARRERVRVLRAEVTRLEDRLSKKTIRAPFSGWIAEKRVERGEWVDQGGSVATMVDLSRIHVRVPVPERYLPLLKVGETARVSLDALPGRTFFGRILSLLPTGDAKSRAFPVKVEIPRPEGLIKEGMLARVTLSIGKPRAALLVPKDALILEGLNKSVFVVKDNVARRLEVEILGYQEDAAEVRGNLKQGDLVIVRGNERIREGQAVVIMPNTTQPSPGDRP